MTNLRCNQRCTYCTRRAERDDLAAIAPSALRAEITRAAAKGAGELRLTGGEPTLRRDLEALVEHARREGIERITVETNATLVDDARAQALSAAGLRTARVNLVGADDRVDAITRDPGGITRSLAGTRALLRAGVAVEVVVTLTRETAPLVTALPAALLAALDGAGRPTLFEATAPDDVPDPDGTLPAAALVDALRALERACAEVAIPLRLAPGSGPPPCAFPPRARPSHLYALSPRRGPSPHHRTVDACARCAIADRCPGWSDAHLRRHPLPDLHPITDERARRRLSVLRPLPDQIAAELVSVSVSRHGDAVVRDETVRINFQCNQSCTFCFVSTHLPAAHDARIETAIREAGARGSRVVISGGEPTLNARLPHWIRLARSVSTHPVCLQTNAVRLDDEALCRAVIDAGLGEAFVSLHGADAATSDRVTEAPGTFARTLRGVDNLRAAGLDTTLNFVFCETNRHAFADVVRLAAARWPGARLSYSFIAMSTDLVPRDRNLTPRYTDAIPQLAEGLREAARLGVSIAGFEAMCGLPLCLLPDDVDPATLGLVEVSRDVSGDEFLKPDACRTCRYDDRCYGLRRSYAALYGTDELHPL